MGREMGRILEACGVCFTVAGTSPVLNPSANSARQHPGYEEEAGDRGGGQWKGALQSLRTAHLSLSCLSHHLLPSPPSFFPPTCSHLPSHSYVSHQHPAPSSSEITPSFLPLGSEAQRGGSPAWRHTASPLPGPISKHLETLFPTPTAASFGGGSLGLSSFPSPTGEMIQPHKMTMSVLHL